MIIPQIPYLPWEVENKIFQINALFRLVNDMIYNEKNRKTN